jgi:hypothetical protein
VPPAKHRWFAKNPCAARPLNRRIRNDVMS